MPAYTPPPEDYPPLSEPMAPLYGWEMEAEVDPLPQVSIFYVGRPVMNCLAKVLNTWRQCSGFGRIRKFLGHPNLLVRGTDPDPDPSIDVCDVCDVCRTGPPGWRNRFLDTLKV
jgi:hypothetical protein